MAKKASAKKSSAKKKTAPKKGAKAAQDSAETTTLLMPPTKTITDLVKWGKDAKKDASAITGRYGEKVQNAVADKHVDRKALAIVRQLDALSQERLHITYFHLLRYMDDLEIPTRAKAQEELFEQEGTGEEGDDDEKSDAGASEGREDNVTSIGSAARKVTESAGGGLH